MPPSIHVEVTGDAKGLSKAFGDVESAGGKLGSSLAKVGKAVAVAGVALAGGFTVAAVKSVKAASDLSEQINKTSVVFGKSGKEVAAWSGGLARDFGLSSRAALEAAGNFGNMLVPMGFTRTEAAGMSKTMVELAGDMASFNNVPVADALEKIRAGLAGEAEPLRTMGVFLSDARLKAEAMAQGLYSGKGALDASAKAAATYSLILKDSKDAQGDFARTSDSLANAQRSMSASWENISASLGSKLLPAVAGAAAGIASFLDQIDKAKGASAKFGVVMGALRTIAQRAWTALRAAFAAINWGAVWNTVSAKITAGVSKVGSDAMAAVAAIDWGAVGKAIGDGIVKALGTIEEAVKNVDWNNVGKAMVEGFKATIESVVKFLAGVNWGAVVGRVVTLYISAWRAFLTVLGTVGLEIGKAVVDGVLKGMEALASLTGEKVAAAAAAVAGAVAGFASRGLALGRAIFTGATTGITGITAAIMGRVGQAIDAVAGMTGRAASAGAAVGRGIYNAAVNGITGITAALSGRVGQAVDAVAALAGKAAGAGAAVGKAIYRGVVDGLQGLAGAVSNAVRAAINAAIALVNAGISRINSALEFSVSIPGVNLPGPLPDIPGASFGVNPPDIPQIPGLAAGGIVKGGRGGVFAQIGEGRRDELVQPLPRNGRLGGTLQVVFSGPVYADERGIEELTRKIQKVFDRNSSRNS